MGAPGAYLTVERREHGFRPAAEAVLDFDDLTVELGGDDQRVQASRCMNCGVPFCQSGLRFGGARRATGCPLHNLIPETNDLLFRGRWDDAAARLAVLDGTRLDRAVARKSPGRDVNRSAADLGLDAVVPSVGGRFNGAT